MIKPVDDKYMVKKNVHQLCLPGTGCEYVDMGKEAEAKDFLSPENPTNPGRRWFAWLIKAVICEEIRMAELL